MRNYKPDHRPCRQFWEISGSGCCLPAVTLQEPFAQRRGQFWNVCRRKLTNNEETD